MTGDVPIWMVPTKSLGQLSKRLAKLQTVENASIANAIMNADRWKMATESSQLESNCALLRAIVKSGRMFIAVQLIRAFEAIFMCFFDSDLQLCNRSLMDNYRRRHLVRDFLWRTGEARIPKNFRYIV